MLKVAAESVRPAIRAVARWVGAGVLSGFLAGLVIGGLGGRLAMLLLRVTSDPALMGAKTDDGFIIGRVSADSGFLFLFCAFAGAAGGIVYVLVRGLIPSRYRAVLVGVLAALVGGSMIVHPGGIDFTVLSPLWLAVALFVLLPGLYGAATSVMAERVGTKTSSRVLPWLAALTLLAMPALIGTGSDLPLAGLGIVLIVALVVASILVPAVRRVTTSAPAIWVGRAGLAAIGIWSASDLVRDAVAIL